MAGGTAMWLKGPESERLPTNDVFMESRWEACESVKLF
jgi:hypothetical protein